MYKYKLKRRSKKECCKQWRYVKFKGTMKKWPVQKPTHRRTQKTRTCRTPWRNRHLEKNCFCVFRLKLFDVYLYICVLFCHVKQWIFFYKYLFGMLYLTHYLCLNLANNSSPLFHFSFHHICINSDRNTKLSTYVIIMLYDLSLTWQFTKHRHHLHYDNHNGNNKFDNVRTEATHISGP